MARRFVLSLQVRYSAPIFASRRVLRVLPLERASQKFQNLQVYIAPSPDTKIEKIERWGTRALVMAHLNIDRSFDFRLEFEGDNNGQPLVENTPGGVWRMPSRGVNFGGELQQVGRDFSSYAPPERALRIAKFCLENLRYTPENTPRPPRSTEIWTHKTGSCAQFCHVFLAICRQSALPARYVSGFGAQNGALHAWAEVYFQGAWHAFDPTLGGPASNGNFALAAGRDFYDCAPHLGSFHGDADAEISLWCQNSESGLLSKEIRFQKYN